MNSRRPVGLAPLVDIRSKPRDHALVTHDPYRFRKLASLANAIEGAPAQAGSRQHFGK